MLFHYSFMFNQSTLLNYIDAIQNLDTKHYHLIILIRTISSSRVPTELTFNYHDYKTQSM